MGKSDFLKTEQQHSRVDYVCEFIKDKIIHLEWQPGDRVDENTIAKSIEVSRLTVREALSKLEENKILIRKHWKGYQLRKLSLDEITDTLEVRLNLELFAYKKFFENFTADIIPPLDLLINQAENLIESGDFISFRKKDFQFHKLLYEYSRNEWIPEILNRLYFIIDIVRFQYCVADKQEAKRSIIQHREIIELLKKEDQDGLLKACEEHHLNFQNFIIKKYREQNPYVEE